MLLKKQIMRRSCGIVGIILLTAVCSFSAYADDPRCSIPPYGGTIPKFQAFVKNFGHLITPTKTLPALCNMKYGGADRTALYNLGFTDQEIDTKDTIDLAVEVVIALKKLGDKIQ